MFDFWFLEFAWVLDGGPFLRVGFEGSNFKVECVGWNSKKKIVGLSLVGTVLECLYQYVDSFCLEVCHFQIVGSWVKTKNWRC